jgi:hypothetical protein
MTSFLIFQIHDLPELAPFRRFGGCREFTGPVPPSLWMSYQVSNIIAGVHFDVKHR